MNVMVLGSGGREHALVWKLSQSPRITKLYAVPGNPGISELAECVSLDVMNNEELLQFANEKDIHFTVVGPEALLVNGVVDCFRAGGRKIFGPTKAAAELEGSKTFTKELMQRYHVPSAEFGVFRNGAEAKAYIRQKGAPIVVKADGLAAGKGVVVAMTLEEAEKAVDMMLEDGVFGNAGSQVVIEEFMNGEEASVMAFTDGYRVVPMVAAQDHKRVFDNDQGPNTGGMGAYAPAPVVPRELMAEIQRDILQPVVDAMRKEGRLYQGCIYAGLMITEKGPKVIEFNARFGDPETQVVLPLLAGDVLDVLEACMDGSLQEEKVKWLPEAAVCVVMTSAGYPGDYRKGDKITGFTEASAQGAVVFHAGTAKGGDGGYVTAGGRVVGVTAVEADFPRALDKAYRGVKEMAFAGCHYRNDIGGKALKA